MIKTNTKSNCLKQKIADCLSCDQHRLRRRLGQLNQQATENTKDSTEKLLQDIDQSISVVNDRIANQPQVHYPENLPITEHLAHLSKKIQENQVIIVCGETGSGKSTQLPKLCLELGLAAKGLIGHTQPRRLAAKTIAQRVSDELQTELGSIVGYKIRHRDTTSDNSLIKIMTDGILLAEMQNDRWLSQYTTIIIDEAHERSLNIDFILGYLKQLIKRRSDLKVIVTSATIDVERFSEHFESAPVIQVEGRNYPVETRYRPVEQDEEDENANEKALLQAIQELSQISLGDILVFLQGEYEINIVHKFLQKHHLPNTDILPLYSRLASSKQSRVFKPHKKRHIILSTNVAETSLTIPGISYVVDFGYAKISRYSYRSKVQRLPIEKISQASANQRQGRCGRTHEGVCIRLYSEEDYLSRPQYTEPEIYRTNLATVILKMKSMKLGDINDFPFIDPPNSRFINDGLRLLNELSAIDKNENLTKVGKQLSVLPIDPRLGRMLIAANDWNCVSEILIIVSMLAIQDPRERPLDAASKADKAHSKFKHKHSDFISLLNLWVFYQSKKKSLSNRKLKKLCKTNFLSFTRMLEWEEIHRQLSEIVKELGFSINNEKAELNSIHCALLNGLLSHVAYKNNSKSYLAARSAKCHIFPGSNLFESLPKWIMAAEFIETSKLYARTVAKIDPNWLLKPAKHLLQRSYFEPHWDSKKQHISAYETIELYGLTIVSRQKVSYARINPVEARGLFIQLGLVELNLQNNARFYEHNKKIINEIKLLETKSRRLDKLDESKIYEFYDKKIPASINSLQTLDGWRKQIERENAEHLYLSKQQIIRETDQDHKFYYPDTINLDKVKIPLKYEFEPSSSSDGVTIEVPIQLLNKLSTINIESVVPGYVNEIIERLLKSLPKSIRKKLLPMPSTIEECVKNIDISGSSLIDGLCEYLESTKGLSIDKTDFSVETIPDYLRPTIKVISEDGKVVAMGKEINSLINKLSKNIETSLKKEALNRFSKTNIESWEFSDLPVSKTEIINKIPTTVYPALCYKENILSISYFGSLEKAEIEMKLGLNYLYQFYLKKEIKYFVKNLSGSDYIMLSVNHGYDTDKIKQDIVFKTINELFIEKYEITRTKKGFEEILNRENSNFISNANELSVLINKIASLYSNLASKLNSDEITLPEDSVNDIQSQLSVLFYDGFVKNNSIEWLKQYPRYLDSIFNRIDRVQYASKSDLQRIQEINKYWTEFIEIYKRKDSSNILEDIEFVRYQWMLQEYRVSLFTQELKTVIKVSPKKLDNQRQKIKCLN